MDWRNAGEYFGTFSLLLPFDHRHGVLQGSEARLDFLFGMQFPMSHPRTPARLVIPALFILHDPNPERIGSALEWPVFIDAASLLCKKYTCIIRFFQKRIEKTAGLCGPAVPLEEHLTRKMKATGKPIDILNGQKHKPRLPRTTIPASRTGETYAPLVKAPHKKSLFHEEARMEREGFGPSKL